MATRPDVTSENHNLIGLAVKCKLLSPGQEEMLLARLMEIHRRDPDYSAADLFKKEKILSTEEIDFLLAVKNHLKTKMLDKRFGELGVSNRLVNSRAVEKALDIQNDYFKQTRKSKKIGDILLENQEISLRDKTAILLTQDRIQDHLLEQAMNDIADSEMEKMTIRMRFGAIAVKKEVISIDQLNQALEIQARDLESKKDKRYLGQILQQEFKIPEDEVLHILKIQKELEKKRLALEKAISNYTSEISSNRRFNELFRLTVTPDKMKAHLFRAKASFENIDITLFHNWLKLNGIGFGICSDRKIISFLNTSKSGDEMEIARGVEPGMPRDEKVEFFFDTQGLPEDNDMESCLVRKDQVLARITPHEPGRPGRNVLGHPIAAPEPKYFPLACGEGVVRKDLEYLALTAGMPALYKNRSLFVTDLSGEHPRKSIAGHVTADISQSHNDSDLAIEGDIDLMGKVSCHGLSVSGNVYGNAIALGDIRIKGKGGMEKPLAGYPDHRAQVSSAGSVHVTGDLANADITAAVNVTAPKSQAISCTITAAQDIVLKNVRSGPKGPCTLKMGVNPGLPLADINNLIKEQKAILETSQYRQELAALELKQEKKRKDQNRYLRQKTVLERLLRLCQDQNLKHLGSLEEKIKAAGNPLPAGMDKDPGDHMNPMIDAINTLAPEDQARHLEDAIGETSRMYRASVNARERFSSEYRVKSEFIQRKIKKNQPEIDKAQKKLEALQIKKDRFLLSKKTAPPPMDSMIKVKNMVEAGTVIQGENASLTVEQSIYGVKMKEVQDPSTGLFEISIEGYYD